tara:strand:- start:24 stop:746 length:723 start_codon:yes stop_codon:yes gene_type:complete
MRIREPNSRVATCSECGAFFPKTLDKCKKCGTPDQPKAYKIIDTDSVIGVSKCQLCNSIAVDSLDSCSNPSCNAIFIGTKSECPKCKRLYDNKPKICDCGYDFILKKDTTIDNQPVDENIEKTIYDEELIKDHSISDKSELSNIGFWGFVKNMVFNFLIFIPIFLVGFLWYAIWIEDSFNNSFSTKAFYTLLFLGYPTYKTITGLLLGKFFVNPLTKKWGENTVAGDIDSRYPENISDDD